MKRIKHNDLTHYFLRPHKELPQAYLKSCKKFFDGLKLHVWAQAFWGGPTRKSSSFGAIISYNILYTRVSQEKKENKYAAPAAVIWYIMGY